jgi:hypothetical protein
MGRPFAPKQSRSRPTTPHLARPRPNMLLCVSLRPPHSHLRRSYFGRWNIRELHWHLAAEWVSLPKTLSPRLAVSSESEHDRRSTSRPAASSVQGSVDSLRFRRAFSRSAPRGRKAGAAKALQGFSAQERAPASAASAPAASNVLRATAAAAHGWTSHDREKREVGHA